MLFKKFSGNWKELQSKAKWQGIIILALTCCVIVNSFLTYKAYRSKRTVIIPSHINAALEISDVDASPNFVRYNLVYALSLLYSYTPSSASGRFQEFLISFVESGKTRELRDQLAERLQSIQQVKVSESLEVEQFVFSERNTALIRGKIYRYSLGQPIATEALYLKIAYRIADGNLKIGSITAMTYSDFSKIYRGQQIEGKKIEEQDKKRIRRQEAEEKKARKAAESGAADEGSEAGEGVESWDDVPDEDDALSRLDSDEYPEEEDTQVN